MPLGLLHWDSAQNLKTSVLRFLRSVLLSEEVQIWGTIQQPTQRHLKSSERRQGISHGLYLLMDTGHS